MLILRLFAGSPFLSFCVAVSIAAIAFFPGGLFGDDADRFDEDVLLIEGRDVLKDGRDSLVAAYEQLLRDNPKHPHKSKAMLLLASLWTCKTPELGIEPNSEIATRWLREARDWAPQGSIDWCDATLRLSGEKQTADPDEGRRLLEELVDHAPNSVVEVHALYRIQVLEQSRKRLAEAEQICLKIQGWLSDPAHLPKGMLEKGKTFEWMQASAKAMMFAWAEMHDVPKAKRAAKIAGLVEKFPTRMMPVYQEEAIKHMEGLLEAPSK